MRARRGTALVALVLSVALTAAACTEDTPEPTPQPTAPAKTAKLTFGVWGADAEIAAYQDVVDTFNAGTVDSEVRLKAYPDHDAEIADIKAASEAGDKIPDVFLVSRRDLAYLREKDLNQPVDGFLDERAVDVGDGYSRDALEAFAADRHLQCMPYGISPMVIYYNKALVDFAAMRARGLNAPVEDNTRWSFAQFAEAASFATRPRKKTRGLYVDPTLRGLAPFVYSGGGDLFDDDDNPTSLDLSSDDSRNALQTTLELLRSAPVNLTAKQVARKSPVEWFKEGRVGMIEGFRSLVPELRAVPGLDFDVMSMPQLDSPATIGDITGLCVSATTKDAGEAADLLVHLTSTDSVARVVQAGYLAPANQTVALSDDYAQPGQLPEHSGVFVDSVRSLQIPPLLSDGSALEAAVAPNLQQLVNLTTLDADTLQTLTTQIDETSRTILDPEGAAQDSGDSGDTGSSG